MVRERADSSFEPDRPDNLVAFLEGTVRRFPGRPAFGVRREDGTYRWMTFGEIGKRVDALRGALAGLGLKRGDAVGIIANNRPEWAIAAFAAYGLGARFVPMYEAEIPRTWRYIVEDASVRMLFVSRPDVLERLKPAIEGLPSLERIFLIEGEGPDTMADLERKGADTPVAAVHPAPGETAALIYTSGTTGDPKGVLLTHGNFTSNSHAGRMMFPMLTEEDVCLSILPWAHSYGQTAELYTMIQVGASIGIMGSVNTLQGDFRAVRPTFLIAVPRVFNRIYDGIIARMNREGGVKKKLFFFALDGAKEKRRMEETGKSSFLTNLKWRIGDRLVFRKIREAFGGRLRGALSGSAVMNPEIARFFFDVGVPVYDCYGLTETSPAVTMNSPASFRLGTVGRAIDRVKVVIDASLGDPSLGDGEIVVYGPNVMMGYHNKPEETRAVLMEDGGLRTGDRGRLDSNGFLSITGRIKEQYKLENGKFVFPTALEEDIRLVPLVENAMVYGENRPYNVCLVVLDPAAVEAWGRERKLPGSPDEWAGRADVREEATRQIVESLRKKYGGYEIPARFLFLGENFSLEGGTLTQTLKLKRNVVFEHYRDLIERAYEPKDT